MLGCKKARIKTQNEVFQKEKIKDIGKKKYFKKQWMGSFQN